MPTGMFKDCSTGALKADGSPQDPACFDDYDAVYYHKWADKCPIQDDPLCPTHHPGSDAATGAMSTFFISLRLSRFESTQGSYSCTPRETHFASAPACQDRTFVMCVCAHMCVCAGFHVSDDSFNYEEAAKYCESKSSTLASIYTAEELAEARAAIKAKGIDKAITSAFADGTGWKWREKTEYWKYDEFPLNTGKVTDMADPKGWSEGMYSLHGDGDFIWDADGREEKHPALCRIKEATTPPTGAMSTFYLSASFSLRKHSRLLFLHAPRDPFCICSRRERIV